MTIKGFLDFVDPLRVEGALHVQGWAYDSDAPGLQLAVEIFLDDRRLDSTMANQSREDLTASGIGDHAFKYYLREELDPDDLPRLVARVTTAAGRTVDLPRWVPRPAASISLGTLPFPGVTADSDHHPVFVLGAPRSGTSAVAQSLISCTQYKGNQEGHVITLLDSLSKSIQSHYASNGEHISDSTRDTMIKQVPAIFFEDAMSNIFIQAMQALFPDGYWLDKTPSPQMTTLAPRLLRLWPNAKFLFLRRRGIENVMSRLTKFNQQDLWSDCRWWSISMEAWTNVRSELTGSALELDQHFVATAPDRAAREIGRLLRLEPGQIGHLGSTLARHRPERTSKDPAAALDPATLGWSTANWTTFESVCGPWMDRYNYSRDGRYFSNAVRENKYRRI